MPCFPFSCLLASGKHSFMYWDWEAWGSGPACFVHCSPSSWYTVGTQWMWKESWKKLQVFSSILCIVVVSHSGHVKRSMYLIAWAGSGLKRLSEPLLSSLFIQDLRCLFSSCPGFPSVSANTTLISRPAFSRAWLRLLSLGLGISCPRDFVSIGWCGPTALTWEAIWGPGDDSECRVQGLVLWSTKSPPLAESVSPPQPVNQDLLCLFVHWVVVGTCKLSNTNQRSGLTVHVMAAYGKMEEKNLQTWQPVILISFLLSPRGSQTTNEADFKNIFIKTKTEEQ